MHDIDRALFEMDRESGYETSFEGESSFEDEFGGQAMESEMAYELLEITTNEELDNFLGDLVNRAVGAARNFASSDVGKAVGGVLKSAAKAALPSIGSAAGNFFGGSTGAAIGQRAGQWLGSNLELGLQTEGLSLEDQEQEAAQAFVRFATETAKRAAAKAGSAPPQVIAQQAATASARKHLPGLLQGGAKPNGGGPQGRATQGRWVRRGRMIVVLDA